jgi:Subtilase family
MKNFSHATRNALSTTAALALLASASAVHAQADSNPSLPSAETDDDDARPIEPLAGRIRTFAGDVTGTAGRIRTFESAAEGSAGRIRTFAGNVASFAGRIRTFQGEALPASGTNTAFWGSLTAVSGTIIPEAGRIRTFSGELEGSAGRIRTFASDLRAEDGTLLTYGQAQPVYDGIAAQISTLVNLSQATFGPAVEAQTGQSFDSAFAQRLLGKYGIDLTNPNSLYGLSEVDLELFLLDWNDNLMNYSGRDQVDHWMQSINWSPSLTQQVTGGVKAKIGLLDFTVTGAETANIVQAKGISTVAGGHGDAVISLLTAAHDGRGVMGIAPNAQVVSYNPFDSTNTAGWADIETGLRSFADARVSVVNISLGVPGWALNDGWNDVFAATKSTSPFQSQQLFVLAAGNDGVVQPQDIEWSGAKDRAILVVGSVDPFGTISTFSNTPGDTCLLTNGVCASAADRLKNRFLVAPGEFILVSDGQGGVTRLSGTSFAAPLVSGTATLIADRWPWLAMVPKDIANIILTSAKDVGAPGVDAVYGYGTLDVTAALSPKDFNALTWKITLDGSTESTTASAIASTAVASKKTWETKSAYLTVFENTLSSFRDFVIPLSSKLIGQTNYSDGRMFQAYLQSRFWGWVGSQSTTSSKTTTSSRTTRKFVDDQLTSQIAGFGSVRAAMTLKPREFRPGIRQSTMPFDGALSFASANNRFGFQFGTGNGAVALGGNSAFGLSSDYDINTGGANPFLAMASGSGFAAARFAIDDRLSISASITGQRAERDLRDAPSSLVETLSRIQPYQASANMVTINYQASDWLNATASYTLLREDNGLLGVQSLDASDFAKGSVTDAGTYGMDVAVTPTLSIGASATVGRTRSGDKTRQSIVVSKGGAVSTAFQFAVSKAKLFDSNDSVRVTLSQPLHIERGSIDFQSVEVVDRQTGALGLVTQTIGLQGGKRSYVTEAIYRRSALGGKAEFNLFGRALIGGTANAGQDASLTIGTAFQVAF